MTGHNKGPLYFFILEAFGAREQLNTRHSSWTLLVWMQKTTSMTSVLPAAIPFTMEMLDDIKLDLRSAPT